MVEVNEKKIYRNDHFLTEQAMIQFIGWHNENGTCYRAYRIFNKYLIHIGGRFPYIHGSMGVPF